MTKAVFLDRDGVINALVPSSEGPDSPRSPDEFTLLPGVSTAIRTLNRLGLPVVVISNQPGVAKGKYAAQALQAITNQMTKALGEDDAVLQGVYYCMHHPEAVRVEYRKVCDCRKPMPGLLRSAARDLRISLAGSYMVGDQPRDMVAGKSVGCTTFYIYSGAGPILPREADHPCRDLPSAAALIAEFESVATART